MVEIISAHTRSDFQVIAQLAQVIWREHYIPIIGARQVEYMLEKFQSVKAMREQAKKGFEYFIIYFENVLAGYMSIREDNSALFLSKFYVLGSCRGQGIGKKAMHFIEEKAKKSQLKSITLTVNKNNLDSIKVYETLGFVNTQSITIAIGNGFVMDDYEMVKFF